MGVEGAIKIASIAEVDFKVALLFFSMGGFAPTRCFGLGFAAEPAFTETLVHVDLCVVQLAR